MLQSKVGTWERLERRSAPAFLAGGSLLVGSTTLKGAYLLTPDPPPAAPIALVAAAGMLAALVGGLGLYPRLAGRAPRLSLAGIAVTGLAGVGTVVVFAWTIGATLLGGGPGGGAATGPPEAVFVLLALAVALGFAAFGVGAAWTGVPSRAVGGLLLAFTGTWVAIVAVGVAFGAAVPDWLYVVLYGGQPVALLGTGHELRGTAATGATEPSMDATAG